MEIGLNTIPKGLAETEYLSEASRLLILTEKQLPIITMASKCPMDLAAGGSDNLVRSFILSNKKSELLWWFKNRIILKKTR